MSKTRDDIRLYNCWSAVKGRCLNPNNTNYKNYGARGITVCDEWRNSFAEFKAWATANGFKSELQIDRIDNERGYRPDNCRWVDALTNNNNQRNSLKLPNGAIASQVSKKLGLCSQGVWRRIRSGMPIELAISVPKMPPARRTIILTEDQARIIKFSSEVGVVLAWRFGVSPSCVCRIRKGKIWKHI